MWAVDYAALILPTGCASPESTISIVSMDSPIFLSVVGRLNETDLVS